jgi:DNA-binding transcriptional ArsR family regulator
MAADAIVGAMASQANVAVDPYVLDVLMPDLVGHDRQPTAFLVYLRLWRMTIGGTRTAEVSLRELSEQTGMSKRAIQDAVEALARRRLITLERERPTAVPAYRLLKPWKR